MARKKKEQMEEKKSGTVKIAAFAVILIFVIAIVMIARHFYPKEDDGKESEPEILTESELKEIINVSDMYVYKTRYDGIAKVMNEKKPDKVDYYVAYEATVKAGFDFEQIGIDVDNEGKTITVTLPPIEIEDDGVDAGTLDYIFENKKADTETVFAQAYEKCIEDVLNESKNDENIRQNAEENAKRIIEGMLEKFAKGYTINFN